LSGLVFEWCSEVRQDRQSDEQDTDQGLETGRKADPFGGMERIFGELHAADPRPKIEPTPADPECRKKAEIGGQHHDTKRHEMPCHHNLEAYLTAYLEKTGIADDLKGPLFRTIGRGTQELTRTPLPTANAYMMIKRRAAAAGLETKIGNHSFRATGITAYLKNGGTLEKAASMANHASTRTTQLYDRRSDEVTLDEVERVGI
jgi:Phage integrase family